MRTSISVLRWLPVGIFCLIFLLAALPVLADTGTYGISNYIVTLEPQSSGQVRITVEQEWKVISGDIPWITVGLPNDNFSVENFSGSAKQVKAANSNGFSGVRVDLDKDYKPGQTFIIKFTVLQNNLLERLTSEHKWRINYTLGWYDRASIDHIQIKLVSPVDYQNYSSVSPMPTSVDNNVITWDRLNLPPGGRFNVVVESTDGSFLTATASTGNNQGGGLSWTFLIVIASVLVTGSLIFWGIRKNRQVRDAQVQKEAAVIEEEMAKDTKKKKEVEEGFEKYIEEKKIQQDAEGRYYDRSYGDYITPAIWAAIIVNLQNRAQNSRAKAGNGSTSCACVSCACACACACAGGGAAGCSRKSLHQCSNCSVLEDKISKIAT